ncbi:hypothetical protein [Streptomyces sp. bgisy091]|uniref:hypothetical protein n=1 Tax=Streptomyces sp. bgisy091 TaxID=3413778 RepID=UPI003D7115CC
MDYQACYSPDGDWFQVWDGDSDGSSAVVQWELVDGDRFGAIYNADGNQTYRYKNKNLPEGDEVRFRVCEGHWSTKLITAGTCSMYASNPT